MTQPPENIIVEAGDVSFSYPDEPDRYVLNKLNLQVRKGECIAILGESGAGKTTLLKLLCGLLKPVQGQILFEGKPLQGPRNDIALIFQNYGLFPWKTVRENILLPARLRKKRADENELAELLDYLGLREFARRFPAELSGGQLQRTALGRAVMSGASLLLMDEPFSALDLRNRMRLQNFMKTFLEDTGMTSVIVTHSIEEALCMGDRVAVFDPEMRKDPDDPGGLPADAVLGAFFRLVYPVPKVVFMPIIVVMLGIGDSSKICLIFLAIFFQITIIIRDSTAAIDPALSDVMRSMKAGPADTLRHLILPGITPGILTALKSSLGTSVALLMITELFASTSGLGYFIMNSMDARKYPEMYSGILLLMAMSALMYAFLEIAERLLCRWRYGSPINT